MEGSEQQDIQYKNKHHELILNFLQLENFPFSRWVYSPIRWGSSPILVWNRLMASHSSPPHWRTCSFSCLPRSESESEAAMNITLSGCAILTLPPKCLYFEILCIFCKKTNISDVCIIFLDTQVSLAPTQSSVYHQYIISASSAHHQSQ